MKPLIQNPGPVVVGAVGAVVTYIILAEPQRLPTPDNHGFDSR